MQASHAILQLYWTSCSNPLTIELNSLSLHPVLQALTPAAPLPWFQLCKDVLRLNYAAALQEAPPKIAAEIWVPLLFAVELEHSKNPTMLNYPLYFSAEW